MATQSRRSLAWQVVATALVVAGVAGAMARQHAQPVGRGLLRVQAAELDARAAETAELFRLAALERMPRNFQRMHAAQLRRLVGGLRDELATQSVEPALRGQAATLQALAQRLDAELARPPGARGSGDAPAIRVAALKALAARAHALEASFAEPGA